MFNIDAVTSSFMFRIDQLGAFDVLDILLVTLFIYMVLSLVRRSQSAFLVRGLIALALILLTVYLLLPLPTFGQIVWVALLVVIITVPITLQPELRRWLEQFGRRFGFSLGSRRTVAEQVVSPLTRTAENLSATRTGALMVLESNTPLSDVIASGVPVNGQVSSELLQTIFFDKTPLHDGAVIIRGTEVIAAGCVLPLTERELRGQYRLGTRHRAALGMSEASDALCVVVSEETGTISVAQNGRLERGLDRTSLHQRLVDFYTKASETRPATQWRPWSNWHFKMPPPRRIMSNLAFLFLSFVLAMIATMTVRQQNDPFTTTTMTAVPLNILNQPADAALTTQPPRTVSVGFQSFASDLSGLGPNSFQASIDLSNVTEGANRVPVNVATNAERVLIIGPKPADVDVTVANIITRTMGVTVKVEDTDQLSAAYEVRGDALSVPDTVEITGPSPDIERVDVVQAAISVAGETKTVEDIRPLTALDAAGDLVEGITIKPADADVTVIVRRRIDARDVGIRAVVTGSPPEAYWISGLSVTPSNVTVQGNPNTIAEIGGYVETLPVDLTGAVDVKTVEIPLDLPADVQALGSDGGVIGTVTVTASIEPLDGELLVERPVELINDRGTLTVTLEPQTVTVMLSGPLPTLNEIQADPSLVQVVIDALTLQPNTSVEMTPDIFAPDEIETRSIDSVLVTTTP